MRSAGFLASSRSIVSASHSGTAGFSSRSGRCLASAICLRIASAELPVNGGCPAHISYRIAPRLNRSERWIGLFAQRLLRRHVERRAGHESGARELHVFGDAGQAKVGQLDAIVRRFQQNVARLDVAMDQSLRVRGRQPVRGLHADPHDLAQRQLLLARQPLFERFAGDQLHHQVRQAVVARLFDLMHGDDILVRDRRRGPRLAAESLPGHFVVQPAPDRAP